MFARLLPAEGIWLRATSAPSSSHFFFGHRAEFRRRAQRSGISVKGAAFWTLANLRHMDTLAAPPGMGAAELQVWTLAIVCL